jgi:hypothetical protein
MRRRRFIQVAVGTAAAITLPVALPAVALVPESYDCGCGLVRYFLQPEGHYAATHFAGQRFTYALFRQHDHLHQKPRMQQLTEIGKRRRLTETEKQELQRLFIRVAENDVRVLRAVQSENGG